jgi:outer membrane receptor protein involved in Fe transport
MIFGSGLREASPTGIPNGAHLPNYEQVNLGASHTFTLPGAGDIGFRVDLINLFDSKYEIRSGTGVGVGAPSWGPRRGVFAGVTKEF